MRDWYYMAKKGNGDDDIDMPDRTLGAAATTHALSDFQRQLELLEEQNQRRKQSGSIL